MADKPKLAIYWGASCGGCEIAILNIHEKILDVADFFDIVFWPCAMDFKVADVKAMDDKSIDVCLFNGAIRTDENAHMAHLLRRKSKVMVSFGSCATEGCMPGLANFFDGSQIINTVYFDNASIDNPDGIIPGMSTSVDEGELTLPGFWNTVRPLDQVIPVEYYLPGCPPESHWIVAAVEAIMAGELPPVGSVIGMDVTVCDECPRDRNEKQITKFLRPQEVAEVDPNLCLLEQGLFCAGIATRAGCGALCPAVNVGCRGCYGPNEGVEDMGAKLIAGLASVIDAKTPEEVDAVLDTLPDPAGYFYRFSLADSLLTRTRLEKEGDRLLAVPHTGPTNLDPKLKD